jgi:hypothetical protein
MADSTFFTSFFHVQQTVHPQSHGGIFSSIHIVLQLTLSKTKDKLQKFTCFVSEIQRLEKA